MNDSCGLIVNSARSIIYADSSSDFDRIAGKKANELQSEMADLLKVKGLI